MSNLRHCWFSQKAYDLGRKMLTSERKFDIYYLLENGKEVLITSVNDSADEPWSKFGDEVYLGRGTWSRSVKQTTFERRPRR